MERLTELAKKDKYLFFLGFGGTLFILSLTKKILVVSSQSLFVFSLGLFLIGLGGVFREKKGYYAFIPYLPHAMIKNSNIWYEHTIISIFLIVIGVLLVIIGLFQMYLSL